MSHVWCARADFERVALLHPIVLTDPRSKKVFGRLAIATKSLPTTRTPLLVVDILYLIHKPIGHPAEPRTDLPVIVDQSKRAVLANNLHFDSEAGLEVAEVVEVVEVVDALVQ